MSILDPATALVLEERKLTAMRERTLQECFLSVEQVAQRWGVSRSTVECLPVEILPVHDIAPLSRRTYRRYHPLDVLAAEVRLRHWWQAKQNGEGEAYLRGLREELTARDDAVLKMAMAVASAR